MKVILLLFALISCSAISAKTYFVAPPTATPSGNDSNPGTLEKPWGSWGKAFKTANAGDTVYFRGGVYFATATQYCNPSTGDGFNGKKNDPVCFFNYPGEIPILDGINKTSPSPGVSFQKANNVHIKGLTVRNNFQLITNFGYASNIQFAMCNNIVIENCTSYNSGRRGFYISEPDTILILNCDSFNNADSLSSAPGNGGDGFLVFDDGSPDDTTSYVVLRGCRAWFNSDDGYDIETEGYIEVHGCWAINNGYLSSGNGTGFKIGLKDVETMAYVRKLTNCIAAYNKYVGFTMNDRNTIAPHSYIFNNTSYHNGYHGGPYPTYGYAVYNTVSPDPSEMKRTFMNNISYADEYGKIMVASAALYTYEYNSWNTPPGIVISDVDFVSLDSTGILGPRKPDGNLFDLEFLKLSPSSRLIDVGTNVGLPYSGDAPDLGAYEYIAPGANMIPSIVITSPVNNSKFITEDTITVIANAFDPDGPINNVDFYSGTTFLGSSASPFSFTWNTVPAGVYSLTAVATDEDGAVVTSAPINIEVKDKITFKKDEIISLYPNPNNGIFTISFIDPLQSEWSRITINSSEGKIVYDDTMLRGELTKQIYLSFIKPGYYNLTLSRDEIITVKGFVKK